MFDPADAKATLMVLIVPLRNNWLDFSKFTYGFGSNLASRFSATASSTALFSSFLDALLSSRVMAYSAAPMLGIYGFSSPVTAPSLSTPYASLGYTLNSRPPTGMLDGSIPTTDPATTLLPFVVSLESPTVSPTEQPINIAQPRPVLPTSPSAQGSASCAVLLVLCYPCYLCCITLAAAY
ncbi:hypothetical protein Cgig2_032397 [Carnegiea gigantea]|uniref:Uncharacterized protein n=1 Tax=Carnegiea gigantea TaxID=171969 RepID=A0A9Q1GL24_9CARY|nr:hypothetical protein Cgig2_032397 [Carnegiea gigantea]